MTSIGTESAGIEARSKSGPSNYLTYHEISEPEPKYFYSISQKRFRDHASCLQQLVKGGTEAPFAHITFDDGHISQYAQALPVLQEFSLKAIYFVTAGWTGKRAGYMSWKQLEELRRCGHEVQSHGWSHAALTLCSAKELEAELAWSKSKLEDHIGAGVNAISMPGGRWNRHVLEACKQAGYERVYTSDPWIKPGERIGLQIAGRWMITKNISGQRIRYLLEGKGVTTCVLRAKHFAKETVKSILPNAGYESLWQMLARKDKSQEHTQESDSYPWTKA